jgi:hypothetical protein
MKKEFLVLICCILFKYVQAQSWQGIGEFNGFAKHLVVDSLSDVLYIAGGFNKLNNSLNVQGLCRFDGQTLTNINVNANLSSFDNQFFNIEAMVFFDGELYVASSDIRDFGSIEGTPISTQIFKYNGTQWESVFPEFTICQTLKVVDDKLFIFGLSSSGTNYNQFMGIYDGAQLAIVPYISPYPQHQNSSWGWIYDILPIDSGYVLVGQILHNFSGWSGFRSAHIYFWDGVSNNLQFFNQGLELYGGPGDDYVVKSITRFNNEILIGGQLVIDAWNLFGLGLAKAGDGVWNSLTGFVNAGVNPAVQKMFVFQDKLWVVGDLALFNYNSNEFVFVSDVFIWDGEVATRPSDDVFQSPSLLYDIVSFRDTIYVAGSFEFINTTSVTSVARFTGIQTNISKQDSSPFKVFPNPSTHTVYLSSPDIKPGSFVRIYNLSGQLVYEQNVLEQNERLVIATSHIGPPGMYVVQLHSPGKVMAVQKLVVAE